MFCLAKTDNIYRKMLYRFRFLHILADSAVIVMVQAEIVSEIHKCEEPP